jgi:hypothetical protein
VRSGFGCTILHASFIPTLPPGIKRLAIEDAGATLELSLVWRNDSLSPLVPRFVEVAKRATRGHSRFRRTKAAVAEEHSIERARLAPEAVHCHSVSRRGGLALAIPA